MGASPLTRPARGAAADYILEYAANGELLQYINKLGSFDEECTRFYAAEVTMALDHMHGKGILHRCVRGWVCPAPLDPLCSRPLPFLTDRGRAATLSPRTSCSTAGCTSR